MQADQDAPADQYYSNFLPINMQHLCKTYQYLTNTHIPYKWSSNMDPKIQKLEKRFSSPTVLISRKKELSKSKKRINFITILSGDAFKSRLIAEIHVMDQSKFRTISKSWSRRQISTRNLQHPPKTQMITSNAKYCLCPVIKKCSFVL